MFPFTSSILLFGQIASPTNPRSLHWTATNAVNYDIWFGTNTTYDIIKAGHPLNAYDLSPLDVSTNYTWKIVAYDKSGEKTDGPVWHFSTAAASPTPAGTPTSTPTPTVDMSWGGSGGCSLGGGPGGIGLLPLALIPFLFAWRRRR
jgi:hypothetical protein